MGLMRRSVFSLLLLLLVASLSSWTRASEAEAEAPAAPVEWKAHASHILVDTEAEADEYFAQLAEADNKFAAFAKIAKAHSKCPSAAKGGDLGTFGRGQMVPEFDRVAFEEDVGVVHKVQTQFGWHLVLVSTRTDGTEVEDPWRPVRNFVARAMPFISPIILIFIMFWGSKHANGSSGPRAHAVHILVDSEKEADKLFREIEAAGDAKAKKAKLAELAAKHSKCPSGKKGGDLGMFGRGQMVPQFDKVVFEDEVGKLHKVETKVRSLVLLSCLLSGLEPLLTVLCCVPRCSSAGTLCCARSALATRRRATKRRCQRVDIASSPLLGDR